MKNTLHLLSPILVFLGLPACFLAAAFHRASPLIESRFYHWVGHWPTGSSALFLPLLFSSIVMSIALIIVHNLRTEHSLNRIARLRPAQRHPALGTAANRPALRTNSALV